MSCCVSLVKPLYQKVYDRLIERYKSTPALGEAYWTHLKVKAAVCPYFATLCFFAAIAAAFLAPSPLNFYLYVPLAFGNLLLGYIGIKAHRGEIDSAQLMKFQNAASNLTFSQLCAQHGLDNICKHKIVSSEGLKKKFRQEIQGIDFATFEKTYDMFTLSVHKVISKEQHLYLLNLQTDTIRNEAGYRSQLMLLARGFRGVLTKEQVQANYDEKKRILIERFNGFKGQFTP